MNELMREREVVKELFNNRIDVRTLQSWRQQGRGPAYVKLEGRILYRRTDVLDYLASHTVRAKAAA